MSDNYPRDLLGYGGSPPQVQWPQGSRVTINLCINYEEGAEACRLDGDPNSESWLTDMPGIRPLSSARHYTCESLFAYGARAGGWRLLGLLEELDLPATLFVCGQALERNPALPIAFAKAGHEIAGHGYRWLDYRTIPEAIEKKHIRKTLEAIESLTGYHTSGWYTGRRSENTRQLIHDAGLAYDSESYADDLPYYVSIKDKHHLVIPYTLINNDARYSMSPGWGDPEQAFQSFKNTFDCLYREGASSPKLMTIGLHTRLSGHPGRSEALRRFLIYAQDHEHIWFCRREDIANFWLERCPAE